MTKIVGLSIFLLGYLTLSEAARCDPIAILLRNAKDGNWLTASGDTPGAPVLTIPYNFALSEMWEVQWNEALVGGATFQNYHVYRCMMDEDHIDGKILVNSASQDDKQMWSIKPLLNQTTDSYVYQVMNNKSKKCLQGHGTYGRVTTTPCEPDESDLRTDQHWQIYRKGKSSDPLPQRL